MIINDTDMGTFMNYRYNMYLTSMYPFVRMQQHLYEFLHGYTCIPFACGLWNNVRWKKKANDKHYWPHAAWTASEQLFHIDQGPGMTIEWLTESKYIWFLLNDEQINMGYVFLKLPTLFSLERVWRSYSAQKH